MKKIQTIEVRVLFDKPYTLDQVTSILDALTTHSKVLELQFSKEVWNIIQKEVSKE